MRYMTAEEHQTQRRGWNESRRGTWPKMASPGNRPWGFADAARAALGIAASAMSKQSWMTEAKVAKIGHLAEGRPGVAVIVVAVAGVAVDEEREKLGRA